MRCCKQKRSICKIVLGAYFYVTKRWFRWRIVDLGIERVLGHKFKRRWRFLVRPKFHHETAKFRHETGQIPWWDLITGQIPSWDQISVRRQNFHHETEIPSWDRPNSVMRPPEYRWLREDTGGSTGGYRWLREVREVTDGYGRLRKVTGGYGGYGWLRLREVTSEYLKLRGWNGWNVSISS